MDQQQDNSDSLTSDDDDNNRAQAPASNKRTRDAVDSSGSDGSRKVQAKLSGESGETIQKIANAFGNFKHLQNASGVTEQQSVPLPNAASASGPATAVGSIASTNIGAGQFNGHWGSNQHSQNNAVQPSNFQQASSVQNRLEELQAQQLLAVLLQQVIQSVSQQQQTQPQAQQQLAAQFHSSLPPAQQLHGQNSTLGSGSNVAGNQFSTQGQVNNQVQQLQTMAQVLLNSQHGPYQPAQQHANATAQISRPQLQQQSLQQNQYQHQALHQQQRQTIHSQHPQTMQQQTISLPQQQGQRDQAEGQQRVQNFAKSPSPIASDTGSNQGQDSGSVAGDANAQQLLQLLQHALHPPKQQQSAPEPSPNEAQLLNTLLAQIGQTQGSNISTLSSQPLPPPAPVPAQVPSQALNSNGLFSFLQQTNAPSAAPPSNTAQTANDQDDASSNLLDAILAQLGVGQSLSLLSANESAAGAPSASAQKVLDNPGVSLALDSDINQLSEYQILVRKQLEFFVSKQEDVESNIQGRKKQVKLGQVGIRCRHCAHLPLRQRGRGAVYYPTKLSGVYQAAQNMATTHLSQSCSGMSEDLRKELRDLHGQRDTASGGKQYWADTCQVLGLYEDEDGIRFHSSEDKKKKPGKS